MSTEVPRLGDFVKRLRPDEMHISAGPPDKYVALCGVRARPNEVFIHSSHPDQLTTCAICADLWRQGRWWRRLLRRLFRSS